MVVSILARNNVMFGVMRHKWANPSCIITAARSACCVGSHAISIIRKKLLSAFLPQQFLYSIQIYYLSINRKKSVLHNHIATFRAWRYQRGNQNLYIKEGQTTQWWNGLKDKQRSTNFTHKAEDRVTQIPLKTMGELRCSGRVNWMQPVTVTTNWNVCYKTHVL